MVGGRGSLQSASVQSVKFFARVVRFVSNGHMGSLVTCPRARGGHCVTLTQLLTAELHGQ
jgi:hypothetical protein